MRLAPIQKVSKVNCIVVRSQQTSVVMMKFNVNKSNMSVQNKLPKTSTTKPKPKLKLKLKLKSKQTQAKLPNPNPKPKDQGPNLRLISSLRRVTVTFATIKLTSTSASASTSACAPSLITTLKSLLPSGQYIIALASVLMLLIYIEHVASQSMEPSMTWVLTHTQHGQLNSPNTKLSLTQRHRHSGEIMQSSASFPFGYSNQTDMSYARARNSGSIRFVGHRKLGSSPDQLHQLHPVVNKRSSSDHSDAVSRFSPISRFEPTRRPTTESFKPSKQILRQANENENDNNNNNQNYRHSNRVEFESKPKNYSARLVSSYPGQLAQFGYSDRQSAPNNKPSLAVNQPDSPSEPLTFRYSDAIAEPPQATMQSRRSVRLSPNSNSNNYNYNYNNHKYNNNRYTPSYRHMTPMAKNRSPRVQSMHNEKTTNRMYKKVLICDKTLVSLDYVKNPDYKFANEQAAGNGFQYDDNSIELDFDLDEFLKDKQQPQHKTTPIYNNINMSLPQTDSNYQGISYRMSASSSMLEPDVDESKYSETTSVGNSIDRHQRQHQQSNYPLTDQDPLVRCDMWDLEKGLKNRKPPENLLAIAIKTDFPTVRDAINRCRQLSEKNLPPEDEFRDGIEVPTPEDMISIFSIKRGLLPGTKWCGLGDIASTYNDLGVKRRIDICCRAHDHCPIRLKPFRNDYGVFNIALYTKSHCDCDADFYRCLREAHSKTADMLGNLYFNIMRLQCIREEPLKLCREIKPIALGFERCVRYEDSLNKTIFRFSAPPVAY